MRPHIEHALRSPVLLALLLAAALAAPALAATITIVNMDGPDEGLNETDPATPVGGNPGTTVGAQRLFVYNYAAGIWGGILPSNVTILAEAAFNALGCDTVSAVLGSAGPTFSLRDFPGAPVAGHWYHVALGNKLSGSDQLPMSNDITSQFNSNLGAPDCLAGSPWYYGVDGNAGNAVDFLSVVLHELGHGLGFSTTTSGSSGGYSSGFPHIYDRFLLDNLSGLHWDQMNNSQRSFTATQCTRLVWDGAFVTPRAPDFLGDKPILRINSPATIDGDYEVGLADFGAPITTTGVTANVVQALDATATTTDACQALTNGAAVSGKIAIVDRGNCTFATKVKNAQNAGAIGVIVAENTAGCAPIGMVGTDPTITIPAVRVTQVDGNTIKANLGAPVNVTFTRDPTKLAGADGAGRVKMYSPSPFAGGSSISHWDVSADPDLLMEPFNNPLAPGEVDLAKWQLADLGWFTGALAVNGAPVPARQRIVGTAPNPFGRASTIQLAMDRDAFVDLSVYDLAGRRVASLHRGTLEAGAHSFEWRGDDRSGRRVGQGIYIYRLMTPDGVESRQVVMSN